MKLRAPLVRRGDRLTPDLWNQAARAINQGLAAPKDTDSGITEEESDTGGDVALTEIARVTETVRVFNPDDETQYVDVLRITSLTTRNDRTGETVTTVFA